MGAELMERILRAFIGDDKVLLRVAEKYNLPAGKLAQYTAEGDFASYEDAARSWLREAANSHH